MRLIGRPARRRRRSPGQALVEFALVIPLFLTIVVAICEFTFLFTSYVSMSFASHDAVQLAATYGDTAGSDCAVLERIDNDVMTPADPKKITTVDIYWVDITSANASPVAGAENIYTYDGGAHQCNKPDGTTITVPFAGPSPNGYPEPVRCNVNKGIGCQPGHGAVDTVAVKITYQYTWITPFPGMLSGGALAPLITSINAMRLEPVL
jgi:Flp pilus assembly protein TadG